MGTSDVHPAEAFPVQFQTIHGYRRAFRMGGSGPALLLIHGIGDSSVGWLPVMEALAERYTVIAPDLLGHGESDKPRADYSVGAYANGMRDLLEVLGIDTVTVVGHSLGGGVAAQFAYQFPDRCERMVLVSSGGVGRAVTPILRLLSAPGSELVLPILNLRLPRLIGIGSLRLQQALGTGLGVDAEDLQRVFEALPDRQSRVAFARTLRSVVDWRGQVVTMRDRTYLSQAVPIMIVWGGRDPIIPVHHAMAAHRAIPGSRLSVYDGAGHFPHHADADRFVAELVDFVETTDPAEHDPHLFRELLRNGDVADGYAPASEAAAAGTVFEGSGS